MAISSKLRRGAKNEWRRINREIITCNRCPRLRDYCQQIATAKRRAYMDWNYWARPVPNFGDSRAALLIVGLAPAAHGANRTGRMFTGDRSGQWLFRALYKAGFATQSESVHRDDRLLLQDCAITAVCHCAPPGNKPTGDEITNCEPWLTATIDLVEPVVLLALGQIAWQAIIKLARRNGWLSGHTPKFGPRQLVPLENNRWLLGSYHPSQQNTFTGRLTEAMFDDVFRTAKNLIRRKTADSRHNA